MVVVLVIRREVGLMCAFAVAENELRAGFGGSGGGAPYASGDDSGARSSSGGV